MRVCVFVVYIRFNDIVTVKLQCPKSPILGKVENGRFWINFVFSNLYLIAGCKLFRHVEKYSKSSMYRLKTSLINSHSSIEKYFGNFY